MEIEASQWRDKDVSQMFRDYSVSQIRSIKSTISKAADESNQKLTKLVNDKYKDFLLINDKISGMNDVSNQLHLELSRLVFQPSSLARKVHSTNYVSYNRKLLSDKISSNSKIYLRIILNELSIQMGELGSYDIIEMCQKVNAIQVLCRSDLKNYLQVNFLNLKKRINGFIVDELNKIKDYESESKVIKLLVALQILNEYKISKLLKEYLAMRLDSNKATVADGNEINEFLNYNLITLYYTHVFKVELSNHLQDNLSWKFNYLDEEQSVTSDIEIQHLKDFEIDQDIYCFKKKLFKLVLKIYGNFISGEEDLDNVINKYQLFKAFTFVQKKLLISTLKKLESLFDRFAGINSIESLGEWYVVFTENVCKVLRLSVNDNGTLIWEFIFRKIRSVEAQLLDIASQNELSLAQNFQIKRNIVVFLESNSIKFNQTSIPIISILTKSINSELSLFADKFQEMKPLIEAQYQSDQELPDVIVWENDVPVQPSLLIIKKLYRLYNSFDMEETEIETKKLQVLLDLSKFYKYLIQTGTFKIKERLLITFTDLIFVTKLHNGIHNEKTESLGVELAIDRELCNENVEKLIYANVSSFLLSNQLFFL